MNTSVGTSNLNRNVLKCNTRRGVLPAEDSSKNAQQDLHGAISTYSALKHRVIIAMRCATSHRPFNMVVDPWYMREVNLLRPGTDLPSPMTISRDTAVLYKGGSTRLKNYFEVSLTRHPVVRILSDNTNHRASLNLSISLWTDGRLLSLHLTLALS